MNNHPRSTFGAPPQGGNTSGPAEPDPRCSLDATLLRLDGELTIYRAAELKQSLLDALHASTALEIDLSGVSEIDSAGVQLLMLAKRQAQARQRELRLVGHSAAVVEVFELLDLAAFFGDALVVPVHAH